MQSNNVNICTGCCGRTRCTDRDEPSLKNTKNKKHFEQIASILSLHFFAYSGFRSIHARRFFHKIKSPTKIQRKWSPAIAAQPCWLEPGNFVALFCPVMPLKGGIKQRIARAQKATTVSTEKVDNIVTRNFKKGKWSAPDVVELSDAVASIVPNACPRSKSSTSGSNASHTI